MFFRVIMSTDVNEYYKKNANDVQFHLTVEANSFNEAILVASMRAESHLLWQSKFEVVSVTLIEIEEEEETFSQEEIFLTPDQWQARTGIKILDPDGWRRSEDPSWWTPITREEFIDRARISTCYAWPSRLWDED